MVTVRYMFENAHTIAHRERVRIYNTDIWNRIKPNPLPLPAPAPAPYPAPALALNPALNPAPGAPPASDINVWEEVTHFAYRVGEKVEILQAFKPKYNAFVGRFAVIRKIYAKKIGPDRHKDYTFFLEVQGSDAAETAKFRDIMKSCNYRSFTEFLYGDDRCLLPCRATHMRTYIAARYKTPAPHMPTVPVAPQAGSKRPHDSSSGDAKSTRDDSSSGVSKGTDNEVPDININDHVEILNTLFKKFVGYHGVVRKMIPRKDQSLSCWIEIQRTATGDPVAPGLADEIIKLNKNFYTNEELHLPWVCCRADYVVLAEPGLPDPWTPETWARLPLHDRKAHRQKQQQEKHEETNKDKRAKTRRRLDMDADPTHRIFQDYPQVSLGDNVQVLFAHPPDGGHQENRQDQFIGFQGVLRKLEATSCYVEAFVELQRNRAGLPIQKHEIKHIKDWNTVVHPCPVKEHDASWFRIPCNYIVAADPTLPHSFVPQAWPPLLVKDRKMPPSEHTGIRIGDRVQITRTLPGYSDFVGFQGVVTSMIGLGCSTDKQNLYTTCFVELKYDKTGQPATPDQIKTIRDWNKNLYSKHQWSWMKCKMEYVALVDEKPPLQAAAAPSKHEPVRHIKYDPTAKPPWSGGDVKPYLYGRKVVFILEGRRGEPIAR
jgi:hypothetical protein